MNAKLAVIVGTHTHTHVSPLPINTLPTNADAHTLSHGHLGLLALLQPPLLVASGRVGADAGLHLHARGGHPLHQGLHGL